MKGVASSGRGDYYFIDSADSITKNVSKAIHGLMDVVGKINVMCILIWWKKK